MQIVQVNFFQFSRDGLTFVFEDEQGEPVDPLTIWARLELAFYKKLNYFDPFLTFEPYIDGSVISVAFTSDEMREILRSSNIRIELRTYTGSDYDTLFAYEINFTNIYTNG